MRRPKEHHANIAIANLPNPELEQPGPPRICLDSQLDINHVESRRWKSTWSWQAISILCLAVSGVLGSFAYLVIAMLRVRYSITPSSLRTAALLSAVGAKLIEIAFVTVFVSFLGQALSRSGEFDIAGLTMKTWVNQPGILFTKAAHFRAGVGNKKFLGVLTLLATVVALLYTTASDTLVSPKLQWVKTKSHLSGVVEAQYADPAYLVESCRTVITNEEDPPKQDNQVSLAASSCFALRSTGSGCSDLSSFLQNWQEETNNTTRDLNGYTRPSVVTTLDDVSYTGSWLNVGGKHGVNKATLIMPHGGLTNAIRNASLGNLGQTQGVSISAAIPNPYIEVLCVPVNPVQVRWFIGQDNPYNWSRNGSLDGNLANMFSFDTNGTRGSLDLLNNNLTVFEAPRFLPGLSGNGPIEYNTEIWTNQMGGWDPSIYLLAGSHRTHGSYTMCSIKSGLNSDCSAVYKGSGLGPGAASVNCAAGNRWVYRNSKNYLPPPGPFDNLINNPSLNFKLVASSVAISLGFNSGIDKGNETLSRILTQLALDSPDSELLPDRPSLAEALAVLYARLLVFASLGATFRGQYTYDVWSVARPHAIETFEAEVSEILYMSGATKGWEALFFVVLAAVFFINVGCLFYFVFVSKGFMTDWTENDELLALLLDPSTSKTLDRCGGGLEIELQPKAGGGMIRELQTPKTKLVIIDENNLRRRGRTRSSSL